MSNLLQFWMTDHLTSLHVLGVTSLPNPQNINPSSMTGGDYGTNLAGVVKNFIAPILMLVIGIIAMTFLFKRQLTQFFQFIAIAVLVGVFFYTNAAQSLAVWVAGFFGGQ